MTSSHSAKHSDISQLDAMTKGAFSAPTAGERAARVRDWLAGKPSSDELADVFRELSVKDKGAAKLVRERLDEIRRSKGQEVLAAEWAAKAQALLDDKAPAAADAGRYVVQVGAFAEADRARAELSSAGETVFEVGEIVARTGDAVELVA